MRASARTAFTPGESGDRHFDRLRWRCRRGLLELDVVLHDFLARRFAALPAAERAAFERLLAVPDPELLAYLNFQAEPADPELKNIVAKIRQ
jgi:antitoxin CptB